jgi:hypothetical protein
MYSMAGLPPLVGGAKVYHWAGSQPLHPIYLPDGGDVFREAVLSFLTRVTG